MAELNWRQVQFLDVAEPGFSATVSEGEYRVVAVACTYDRKDKLYRHARQGDSDCASREPCTLYDAMFFPNKGRRRTVSLWLSSIDDAKKAAERDASQRT
jgi:hypothetical protein